ncbi:MAG: phytanoyl-CoA dioxygenase family protein [Pseudohongiellaceae bacterium]
MPVDQRLSDVGAFASHGFIQASQLMSASDAALTLTTRTYRRWFEAMFDHYKSTGKAATETSVDGFYSAGLIRQLAILLGLGGRRIFDHLSPAMNALSTGFRYCPELPQFDRTPWLTLATNAQLLSRVANILGSDLILNARIQPVFSLHPEQAELMDRIGLQQENLIFESSPTLSWHISSTPWSMYCKPGLCNSFHTFKITAIIPLREMREETGTVWLLPGSHRYGLRHQPQRAELASRTPLHLQVGDLLLLHPHLFVSQSLPVATADNAMWLLLQFHRPGEPGGFPYLPSLKIHADSDPGQSLLWNSAWRAALENLNDNRVLRISQLRNYRDAERLTNDFQESDCDLTKWVSDHANKQRKPGWTLMLRKH